MRVLKNLDAMPDPGEVDPLEWKRIARGSKGAFNFCESHEPWEFPLISELGRLTRVTHGQLDEDADITLKRWGTIWARDVVRRRGKLEGGTPEERQLIEAALSTMEAVESLDALREQFSQVVREQRAWGDRQRELGKPYYGKEAQSPFAERISSISQEQTEAEARMEDGPLRSLLIALVRAKYVASPIARGEFISHSYSPGGDALGAEEVRYYMEKVSGDVQRAYQYSVVAFPGDNLPSYFYDEMLYTESIETTSGAHSGCRDILEDAVEHGISDEWLISFLENGGNWKGWWS